MTTKIFRKFHLMDFYVFEFSFRFTFFGFFQNKNWIHNTAVKVIMHFLFYKRNIALHRLQTVSSFKKITIQWQSMLVFVQIFQNKNSNIFLKFRPIFNGPKTVQASVTLLEQLPILLEKTNQEELDTQILPMVYLALESNMSQVQVGN